MTHHRSTVHIPDIGSRAKNWRKVEPINQQFRFVVRLAHACHVAGVPYDLTWSIGKDRATACLEAIGDMPTAKALPKAPREKLVSGWKPNMLEASYSLEAYVSSTVKDGVMECKPIAGFVVAHSSGLSLVRPGTSESGEMESSEGDDLRKGWLVTHAASGRGFGLSLPFAKAVKALLAAASHPVDWTVSADELKNQIAFKRAGLTIQSQYGSKYEAQRATEQLGRMAA